MIPIKLNIQKFASSTIYLSVYTGSYNVTFQGRLDVSSVVDSANNQSTVTVSLYARKQNSSSATTGKSWSGNITIDGSSDAFSSLSSSKSVGNSWVLMRTYSKVVSHNTDGSKTIYISGSIKGASGTSLANATSSGGDNFTLDTIPRYFSSTPSISLASKTETTLVYNWSTSENCSAIVIYGGGNASYTGIGGKSGTITVSGLSEFTDYTHYGVFTRSDSGLTSTSNSLTNKTNAYLPYISSAPNFIIGNPVTINIHNLANISCDYYAIGKDNSSKLIGTTTGSSIEIPATAEWINFWYNSILSSPNGVYKIRLVSTSPVRDVTVNGGTYTIDYNASKPTFNDFSFEDVNSATLALTGDNTKFVDGYSTMQVNVSNANKAVGYKGATITNYKINNVLYPYSDNFTQNVGNYNLNNVSVIAVDSRSNEKIVSKSVTLLGYLNPTADISKDKTYYTRSSQGVGTQVTFKFEGTFWNNNFGNVANSLTATYEFKKTGASSYTTGTTPITITTSGNNYSFSGVLAGDTVDNGFDVDKSYNVTITVSDKLSSVQFNYVVIEGSPAIDLYGNCVSLGGMYNETLGGRVQINGRAAITVDDIYPVGSVYLSTNSTSPATLFGGTWTQLTGYYLYAGTGGTTAGSNTTSSSGSGTTGSTTLTAAQSGLRWHDHSASSSYGGSSFYIRHGNTANTDTVAAGTNTTIDEGVGDTWANGFSTSSYSHKTDRVNIGGSVSTTVNGNGGWDATDGHTHSVGNHTHTVEPVRFEVYAWYRTA